MTVDASHTPDQTTATASVDNISASANLPTVATYNCRSLFPKIGNFKTDLLERKIDVGFACEIWEQKENKVHKQEIEKMLELDGLKYISAPRPSNRNGGGAAIVVNSEHFSCERLNVFVPANLEVVYGLLKPKCATAKYKKIILCSFYSPPTARRNTKLADHIVGTLQLLSTNHPNCPIILGGDKNGMDITPILNCGLRLKQINVKPSRKGAILDIIIMNIFKHYNLPIIAPPLNPDNPNKGKPSDHSVPIAVPHTDRYNPPLRNYRLHTYRPLPFSSVQKFGQWMVGQQWDNISEYSSPTEQVKTFQKLLNEKLEEYCPQKTVKLGAFDKPFITAEIKKLDRQKMREYRKRGKSEKYLRIAKLFDQKYKTAAEAYLRKNMDTLKEKNPGQAYSILKRLGAQPGDCTDSNGFTLPSHLEDNLTEEQSAERIATHFAEISQQFPPLDTALLPERVQSKLQEESTPPTISERDTYEKIKSANKPKSGVPGDLPCSMTKEFSVELAKPLSYIINNIFKSAEWPADWLVEYVTPLGKVPMPESEDELRPISLTNFFSKVTEHFVVHWLLEFIGDLIDFRQYGGMKGNSITHYLIEFVNFILANQDSRSPTAILACMVDFSKAFNRQNHNILITKLSDLGVPGWLLKIVMAFLTNRSMIVRYRGARSSQKSLPGGGPQGTLLGLLLFLVLINDVGFKNQLNNAGEMATSKRNMKEANRIHLKYVDDLLLAEAIDLKTTLIPSEDSRPRPDCYHARTGHQLPVEKSQVFKQLLETEKYAEDNQMKINTKKTKTMLFNPATSLDFMPQLNLGDLEIELVEEMRVLGLIVRSDLKWSTNTENMVLKGYKRLWMLRRLKKLGANYEELLDVYIKQVRSVLELAVPVWHPGLTSGEHCDIERVQKAALYIILGNSYTTYQHALTETNIQSLEDRRVKLCSKFAKKSVKNSKFKNWFRVNEGYRRTRHPKPMYCPVQARTARYEKSPLSYLTSILNQCKKKN